MNSIKFLCSLTKQLPFKQISKNINRTLYDASSLGMDLYRTNKERYVVQSEEDMERFKRKMKEYSDPDGNTMNLVFTEDLRQALHIVKNTDEDMELIEQMVSKFNKQNSNMRFGTFLFGPVVMRMYHNLNRPKEAYKMFSNPDLTGFFDQLSSFVILADLLFENKMYAEILEIYKIIRERQYVFGKYPKSVMLVVFAALYKQNTPESLEYALQLYKEMVDAGQKVLRRSCTIVAALALNQKNPHAAIEIISNVNGQSFVLIRSIKVMAYVDVKRPEDALPILRSVMEIDSPRSKQTFPYDVVEKVKQSIQQLQMKDLSFECDRIVKMLMENGYISNEKTFEEMLLSDVKLSYQLNQNTSVLSATLNQNQVDEYGRRNRQGQRYSYRYQRPGLKDLI